MIGEDIRASVFRDTKQFYENFPQDLVSQELIAFARKHAGKRVLDLGCATGNYSLRLSSLGYEVVGVDVNPRYVELARSRGVDAHASEGTLPFADDSFDTVVVFEVLEHLVEPDAVLREAGRVARTNVLFTTPHSGGIEALKAQGLLFEHFADLDHKNFFTEESLGNLLRPHFSRVTISVGDPVSPLASAAYAARVVRVVARIAERVGMLRPRFFSHLFAVAEL